MDVLAYADGIAAGRYTAELDYWMLGWTGTARIWLDFLSITGAVLGGTPIYSITDDSWTRGGVSRPIPAGTRRIRVTLDSEGGFGATDCSWDSLALYLVE